MNGIGIQFLDGLKRGNKRKRISYRKLNNEVDTVVKGLDFAGLSGNGSIEDEEMLRNHLVRTKYIVEQNPMSVATYQHPKQFNKMLGYALEYWDTPQREEALDTLAKEEERLIGLGSIIMPYDNDSDFNYLYGIECNLFNKEEYELDGTGKTRLKKRKNGFFQNIRRANANANLSEDARGMKNAAQEAFLSKKVGRRRAGIQSNRKRVKKMTATAVPDITPNGQTAEQPEYKEIVQDIATTDEVLSGLGSTHDSEEKFDHILQGFDLVGSLGAISTHEDDLQAVRDYYTNVRNLVAASPAEYFDTVEQATQSIGAIDYIIVNTDNKARLQKALGLLAGIGISDEQHEDFLEELGFADYFDEMDSLGAIDGLYGLDGKAKRQEKKAAKKAAKAEKKAAKAQAKVEKKAAKAEAKAVRQQAKAERKEARAVRKENKAVAKAAKKEAKADLKAARKSGDKEAIATAKAVKKAAKQTLKAVKKENRQEVRAEIKQRIKNGFKKIGQGLKKVWKAIVRFNPLTLAARGGTLLAMRTNMFKFAQKIYPGTISQQEAANNGISVADWQKGQEAYKKALNIFEKIGGKDYNFKAAVKIGAFKQWTGSEDFNRQEAEIAAEQSGEITDIHNAINEETARLQSEGAILTNDPAISYEETQQEVIIDEETGEEFSPEDLQGLGEPATAVIITAAAATLAAIGGVIQSIIGKKQAEIENDTAEKMSKGFATDEYDNPIMPETEYDYGDEDWDESEMMYLTQIASNPEAFDNPMIQAALASNPKLAASPIVQQAMANKNANLPATQTGMSTGLKVGLAIGGGVLVLGLIALALKSNNKTTTA